jgi:phosphoribosyl 1,2-cyclic phosphodiesterase
MEVISLQSGSAGNCVFVRSGDTRLLFDAGISGRSAELRLAQFGYDIRDCAGVVISHEHCDHISGIGTFHRKFGLPVYASSRTWNATRAKPSTGCIDTPNHFVPGKPFQIGSLRIETVRTTHDAIEGVCFVIEEIASGKRFGLLTDLGHVFRGLRKIIDGLDAVLIESNYDEGMLRRGPYPQRLKDRISGNRGHISNADAAELLDQSVADLQWVCLGHLSAENNTPEVALRAHHEKYGDRFPLYCADRDDALKLPPIQEPTFKLQANPGLLPDTRQRVHL